MFAPYMCFCIAYTKLGLANKHLQILYLEFFCEVHEKCVKFEKCFFFFF